MARFTTARVAAAALLTAALAGGGAGAGIYAALGGSGTKTASPPRTVTAPAATTAAPSAAPSTSTGSSSAQQQASSQLSVGEIYSRYSDSVVEIDVATSGGQAYPFGGSGQAEAQGTGFVYDTQGHIVTNQHVVDGATNITVTFADGSTYKATLVGQDASTDLAVIKIDALASRLHPVTLGDSDKVEVGDGVVAIGDPFGLDNTVTSGIVSALGREITAPDNSPIENAIQTDAAINHGNSGGPLFDLRGEVIGVTAQIHSDSGDNAGVGFAIPSNTVKSVAAQLISSGTAKHALLGVRVQTIPSSAAAQLGVPAGVAVESVESGSGASRAGLHGSTGRRTIAGVRYPTGGDVLTYADGQKVATAEQLRAVIDSHKPGEVISVTYVRGGTSHSVKVTLGSR